MDYEEKQLIASCLHEAGHVVAAHALSGTVNNVIVALPGYLVDGSMGLAGVWCDDPLDDVVVELSGVIGACFGQGFDYKCTDPRPVKGQPPDKPFISTGGGITKSDTPLPEYQDNEAFIRGIISGGRYDRRRAWETCRKACRTDDEAFELYQALERRAMGLVAEKLFQIKMLADVLERKLTLGKEAITALLGRVAT